MNDTEKPAEIAADGQTPTAEGPDHREKQQQERDERARGQLAEMEAERDALRQRVDALLSAEVRRQLAGKVTDVDAALKLADRTPSDFLNAETGEVDATAISEFVDEFTAARPMFDASRRPMGTALGESQRRVRPDEVVSAKRSSGWADLLAGPPGSSGESET